MTYLEKLRARLKEITARCQAILEEVGEEAMSDEQQKEFDELDAEFKQVTAKIDRAERVARQSEAMEASTGRVVDPGAARTPRIETREAREADENWNFTDMADFAMAVFNSHPQAGGEFDTRLAISADAPTNFHRESGSAEGFMVPPAMRREIWELVFDDSDLNLLAETDNEPTESNSVTLVKDETTPWGATGVQARWAAEGSKLTPTKLETEGEQQKLHKLFVFVEATEELMEDAPRLANRLTRKSAQAIRWEASDKIIYGTGAGQPFGYFNSPALITVTKEAGQAADTIVVNNISKMFSRLWGPSVARSQWITNSDTLPQLIGLTIANQPIWTPPNAGFARAPGGFLLGRPVRFSEHAKTVGDKGDIQLVDLQSYYTATKRSGIKFASSMHLFFDFDMQAFRWTFRLAGQPFLSKPIATPNAATKSHFVVLEDRA